MLSARPQDFDASSSRQALALKTPAKTTTSNTLGFNTILRTNLKENTANRAALLKTGPRQNVFPSTPGLKKSTAVGPSLNVFKESTLGGNGVTNTTKMPRLLDLTNKTPFGNHHLPDSPTGGAFGSPLKAPFQLPASSSLEAPETILRPSKARTSLRVPRVSGGSANGGGLPPVTPAPFGRRKHWEALSPGDVSVEEAAGEVLDEAQTDLDDEIEYMPPPVTELPYDPGFDMPDYREIGASIWKIGNIIDLTTLAGSRPPDKPYVIHPDDIPTFESIVPVSQYIAPKEDLETFIGSKDLYKAYERPVHTSSTTSTTARPAPTTNATKSTKPAPVAKAAATRSTSRSRPGPSSATTSSANPSNKVLSSFASRSKAPAHSRTASRSTPIAAPTRPGTALRVAPTRTASVAASSAVGRRTPTTTAPVTRTRAAGASSSQIQKAPGPLKATKVPQSAAAASASRPARPVRDAQAPRVKLDEDTIEELMAPLSLEAFDFDFEL